MSNVPTKNVPTKDAWLKLRVNTEMRESWKAAALSEGVSFSRWVTESLERCRAEVNSKDDKTTEVRLQRLQMVQAVASQVVPASALEKKSYAPDFK